MQGPSLSKHSWAVITPSFSLENTGRTLDTKKALKNRRGRGVRPGTELRNRIAPLNCLEVGDGSPCLPVINASVQGSAVMNLSESWVAPAPSIHSAVNISPSFRSQVSGAIGSHIFAFSLLPPTSLSSLWNSYSALFQEVLGFGQIPELGVWRSWSAERLLWSLEGITAPWWKDGELSRKAGALAASLTLPCTLQCAHNDYPALITAVEELQAIISR